MAFPGSTICSRTSLENIRFETTRYLLPVHPLIPGACRIISLQSVPQLLYLYATLLLSSEMASKHSPLLKVMQAYLQLIKKTFQRCTKHFIPVPVMCLVGCGVGLGQAGEGPACFSAFFWSVHLHIPAEILIIQLQPLWSCQRLSKMHCPESHIL